MSTPDKRKFAFLGSKDLEIQKATFIPKYVEGLLRAKNAVTIAEETLADHKDKIAFLEEELKNLSKED